MTLEKEVLENVEKPSRKRNLQAKYTAEEKCRAVLSIWSERRKPAEICREYEIAWAVVSQWQNRAMEGMLQALEPRVNLEKGPALSPRLQALLEKREQKKFKTQDSLPDKLEKRFARMQQDSAPPKKKAGRKK